MTPILIRLMLITGVCLGGAAYSAQTNPARAQAANETPMDIIAIQIRRQGYACDKPISAERDKERSKADEAVWILKCENFTYRVHLVPDMGAKVERLNKD